MAFPFTVLPGHIYDLRTVPILISLFYGEYWCSLIVIATLFIYRYLLGGDGFYTTVFSYTPIFLFLYLIKNRYQSLNFRKKIFISMALSFTWALLIVFVSILRLTNQHVFIDADVRLFFVEYCLINPLATWIAVYLLEIIQENIAIQSELQKSEKIHVLGELAASIAHEVRNPLTAIRGFMQLLNQQDIQEKRDMYVRIMIHELDRAESIINNYLSLAKPHLEKFEILNVEEVINQIINVIYSYGLLRNVEIKKKLANGLFITANNEKFSQVVMNLIKNGIESMPHGGVVEIITYFKEDYIHIEIIDQGIGMTGEQIERLGTPFYSTKENGNGIGMMVSYRIIEGMKGKIVVSSQKGKGTKFLIVLPASFPVHPDHVL
ncbi:ATP-binding protein [Fodinisporobacter ferrooxydans]|uniref:histidine kinase n=2 Tax=Fodinisporobacter ferrooxydans TaxID=2901836 RepID=A0ABY4CIN5_9BACL|nr:ATP-binding protein [Alicyclobacillaceae bacterium MYW30-H2]